MALEVCIKKNLEDFKLNVNFIYKEGMLGILGKSGSGKSLLLKCIAGIETPDEGRIVLNNKVLFDSDKNINLPAQKRKIGYLFQNYALFPNMTTKENIEICIPKLSRSKNRVENIIETCSLKGFENLYPTQLSGGQKQRVAIARIIASEPDIIMLDEPFSALDKHLNWKMEREIMNIVEDIGKISFVISHDLNEIYRMSNEIAIINNGEIEQFSNKHNIFKDPENKECAQILGFENIFKAKQISKYEIYLPDLNIYLSTDYIVKHNLKHIAIRACDLQISENKDGLFKCKIIKKIEDINEYIYVLKSINEMVEVKILSDKNIEVQSVVDVIVDNNKLTLI